ncbi:MAG: DUF1801 domain-containing protein [Bacteroidales bacterium]
MAKIRATTVDEYIDAAPPQAREKLSQLRSILLELAPGSEEAIKWGNPVLIGKRILFAYPAYKSHINFMPTASSLEPFRDELAEFKTGKDTIQFPYDKPLPEKLIRKIALHRVKDVNENDAKWMS